MFLFTFTSNLFVHLKVLLCSQDSVFYFSFGCVLVQRLKSFVVNVVRREDSFHSATDKLLVLNYYKWEVS